MFKFVVLCAFVAAAIADPAAVVAPLSYSANVVVPAAAPGVYATNPYVYSSPLLSAAVPYSGFPHFIKKRSVVGVNSYVAPAPLVSTYNAPFASTYTTPYATTYGAALPTTYSSPFWSAPAHFIKKRAAPFVVPSTYVAPAHYAAAPFVTSTYAAGPVVTSPYVATSPIIASHFIKKRSAPLAVAAYNAPVSYSQQSRFDYHATSPGFTYSAYTSPVVYPTAVEVV